MTAKAPTPTSPISTEEAIRRLTILRDDVMAPLCASPDAFDIDTWANVPNDKIEDFLNGLCSDEIPLFSNNFTQDDRLLNDRFDPVTCGTAACVLGSAACHKPFKDLGLRLYSRPGRYTADVVDTNTGSESFSAGVTFFGITRDAAYFLFDPDSYIDYLDPNDDNETIVTPEDAMRHISIVIDFLKEGREPTQPDLDAEALNRY